MWIFGPNEIGQALYLPAVALGSILSLVYIYGCVRGLSEYRVAKFIVIFFYSGGLVAGILLMIVTVGSVITSSYTPLLLPTFIGGVLLAAVCSKGLYDDMFKPWKRIRNPGSGTDIGPVAMQKDVFLSYAGDDRKFASMVCTTLERRGVSCWMAPRDIPPGAAFDQEILTAITGTSAAVLILSAKTKGSSFVLNEVNRAFSKGKVIFTFRVEDVTPEEPLELYLARYQWIDGFPPPVEEKIEPLAAAILALLSKVPGATPATPGTSKSPRADVAVTASGEGPTQSLLSTLSREELNQMTKASVDPKGFGPVTRPHDNADLTDSELRQSILDRNAAQKPTYLLRSEYERRLRQRGL